MGLFRVSEKEKLRLFRENFRTMIADGTYPPDRQQLLYAWCQRNELDWAAARDYVREDAEHLVRFQLQRITRDSQISKAEIIELSALLRRLRLSPENGVAQRFYDLVEHKIKDRIIARAAYLGSAPAVQGLKDEIASYALPDATYRRLIATLEQQHELAKLTSGTLPTVAPSVDLYGNEACHFEARVAFYLGRSQQLTAGDGLLVVTSERLMILATQGGQAAPWRGVSAIQFIPPDTVSFRLGSASISVQHPSAQYIATLLVNAQRIYVPQSPSPVISGKRLA